jgi:hypothetical protein
MNTGMGERARVLPAAFDLLACLTAFYAVSRLFAAGRTNWLVAVPASALASCIAARALQDRETGLSLWIDQLFYAAGLTLLSQYGLACRSFSWLFGRNGFTRARPEPLPACFSSGSTPWLPLWRPPFAGRLSAWWKTTERGFPVT